MTTKLAFASCMDAIRCEDQPVWDAVAAQRPDLLLLLGDHIYMDWGSLASVPSVKQLYDQDPAKATAAFQEEMYGRYRAQWQVDSFRKLVCGIPNRAQNLLMTWDDHDFAWNSAYGAGHDVRTVPADLKAVSATLALQFLSALRTRDVGDRYPDMPTVFAAPSDPPFDTDVQALPDGIELMMLDERWVRTQRDETGSALLHADPTGTAPPGTAVRGILKRAASQPGGLLIVAGSSPLKHRYLLGHQGWSVPANLEAAGSRSYPEYMEFVSAAATSKRPILYLAGDIHRNAYGGPVEPGSTIVQVLSSGAGLGRLLFRKFPGSYGLITVTAEGGGKRVDIDLYELRAPTPQPDHHSMRVAPATSTSGPTWSVPPDEGECGNSALSAHAGDDLVAHLDQGDLTVFCYRERTKVRRKEDDLSGLEVAHLDEQTFESLLLPSNDGFVVNAYDRPAYPEVVKIGETGNGLWVSRQRKPFTEQGFLLQRAMDEAFLQARNAGKSVVLLVHGFNKSFGQSVDQACELRERFNCVPLLFSWPTGSEGGGFFALLGSLAASPKLALGARYGLVSTLLQFNETAKANQAAPGVPAVVLVRSLGAEAMKQAFQASYDRTQTAAITRLILSSPATNINDRTHWVGHLGCPTVVTINGNDQTLREARWATGIKLMGNNRPDAGEREPGAFYLDCTNVPGVERNHDYFLHRVNADLFALNTALIRGEDPRSWLEDHPVAGLDTLV